VRRGVKLAVCFATAISFVMFTAVPAKAQLQELLNLLIPSPPAPPPPAEPAAPPPPAAPAAPVSGTTSPGPAAAPTPVDPRTQPFPIPLPNIRRSPARSTKTLIERLQAATSRGVPLETAILAVASPFPVAGQANFSHDWGFPRYTPTPHTHKGTDIFADFGTPIVTSESGKVISKGATGAGGISAWVKGDSGMAYYYAHMQSWANDLAVGQRVEKGYVIGFVGDTGNAEGGASHLHIQTHPNGGPGSLARDPKPFLDDALRQAEEQASAFAQAEGGVPNTAGRTILPGIVVTKQVDKLLQAADLQAPEDILMHSLLDPTLGALALARRSAASGSMEQVLPSAAETREEQRLDEVRQIVRARADKLMNFMRDSETALVMGPDTSGLISISPSK
jgi:murein DD-endopeptidase MepM/ murein hydrolase activator NlpD